MTDDTPDAGDGFIDEHPFWGRSIPRRASLKGNPLRRLVVRLWEVAKFLATEDRKLWARHARDR